jgi:EAL and modified HD-GYP domain-containing signal transduction protein
MTDETAPAASCFLPTFLARQPVFDVHGKVWGYELLFRRGPEADRAVIADCDQATISVAAESTFGPEDFFGGNAKVLINFGQRSILDAVPYALPPGQTVVQVPEEALLDDGVLRALETLGHDGYSVAVDDFAGRADCAARLGTAELFIIDVLAHPPREVAALLERVRAIGATALAKKVETMEAYAQARHLGFTLFQGFFFKRPELVAGRKLTSHQQSRFALLKAVEVKDPDFEVLARDIQTDVSISYRLLFYLNSAAFAFSQPIRSIRQAIVLLGWKQLQSWLRVVILSDVMPAGKPSELFFSAVQRAKFLELIARSHEFAEAQPDSMFLLGLFSLLEPMLDTPMADIVDNLPLDGALKDALLDRPGYHGKWLDLVRAHENGHWEQLDTLTDELALNRLVVAVSYYKSVLWANAFFQHGAAQAEAGA